MTLVLLGVAAGGSSSDGAAHAGGALAVVVPRPDGLS